MIKKMSADKRRSRRTSFHFSAWIVLSQDNLVNCQLLDISESGAKLLLPENIDVPSKFLILFAESGWPVRRCELVWKDGAKLGLQFIKISSPEIRSVRSPNRANEH